MSATTRCCPPVETSCCRAGRRPNRGISARRCDRTGDCPRLVCESVVRGFRIPGEGSRQSDRNVAPIFLDLAGGLLDNMKFQQEGNNVSLQTSVELSKARLDALMTTIIASTQPA